MAPESDPIRALIERTLASHQPQGPLTQAEDQSGELLLMTHPIDDGQGTFVGAMLVARNLGFMKQVHSTLNYSRKLAALGRLMAGVAHEVKNPLNAMTIHLELLKNKLARAAQPVVAGAARDRQLPPRQLAMADGPSADIGKHVDIIANEIQRLDQVLNGFLRFARPDELKLQPVHLAAVVSDVVTTVTPEAERCKVTVKHDCPRDLPEINADPAMMRQALLNLALNGCQAMPDGGTLRITCRAASARPRRDGRGRHRRRHRAGEPAEDFRPLLHDEGKGQRDRAVDGLPNRPAARRRGRGPEHARDAAPGSAWCSRRRRRGLFRRVASAPVALHCTECGEKLESERYCGGPFRSSPSSRLSQAARPLSAKGKPTDRPAMNVPPPPPRLIEPAPEPLPEPVAELPAAPPSLAGRARTLAAAGQPARSAAGGVQAGRPEAGRAAAARSGAGPGGSTHRAGRPAADAADRGYQQRREAVRATSIAPAAC